MVESPFADLDVPFDPLETEETKATTSAEKAFSDEEFELLLDGAKQLEPKDDLVAQFTILLTGRLGLRSSELMHLRESWIDWEMEWIDIPAHQPCKRGRDGGICSSCRQHARQMADREGIELSKVEPLWWKAKTAKSARKVPFSFSDRCQEVIHRYFDELPIDKYAGSDQYIRRKLRDSLGASDLDRDPTDVRPHYLRATAANYHADTGMDVYALKSFMGWSRSETAERYMRDSDVRTKIVFDKFHSDG